MLEQYKIIYATNALELEDLLNKERNKNYSIDKMCVSPWFENVWREGKEEPNLEFQTDSIYVVLKRD